MRAVARAAGTAPAAVPAHPEFLRKLLDRAAPASIGLTPASWNNARSLTGKVLAWAGLATIPGHYQAPLTAGWAELWAKLPVQTALSYDWLGCSTMPRPRASSRLISATRCSRRSIRR